MTFASVKRFIDLKLYGPFLHRYQRAKYGYSVQDTFSFDEYLAKVIAGGVNQLRLRHYGPPTGLTESEWDAILDKIVSGFNDYSAEGYHENNDSREAMKLLIEYFHDLWDL